MKIEHSLDAAAAGAVLPDLDDWCTFVLLRLGKHGFTVTRKSDRTAAVRILRSHALGNGGSEDQKLRLLRAYRTMLLPKIHPFEGSNMVHTQQQLLLALQDHLAKGASKSSSNCSKSS